MTQYNMYEAKTNFSKISKLLEDRVEDFVVISRNGKPILKITLYDNESREGLFGCAKGMFEIPEDFDDIDISNDFDEEIFPLWNIC